MKNILKIRRHGEAWNDISVSDNNFFTNEDKNIK